MPRKIPRFQDLGFGTKIIKAGERLIKQDGSFNIIRKGNMSTNVYQSLINMSSWKFLGYTLLFLIVSNSIFAGLFLMIGIEQLNGIPEGSIVSDFLYAFFFSVQTFTTVGYGAISPHSISANFIASICATIGLGVFAITTGLFFARFSRPRSHVAFSKQAIITPYQDVTSFQCRLVNTRTHNIINIEAQMSLTWLKETSKGTFVRKYSKLKLEREKLDLFPMNWTLVHPITENSPLFGKTNDDLKKMHAEFLLMTIGYDESYNQKIHSNTSYIYSEIKTGVKFKQMYFLSEDGPTKLYLDDLSALIPLEE